MYLTVSPIREDRLGRSFCEQGVVRGGTCQRKAEFLVMFRKTAHPRDSKPDKAFCREHAFLVVEAMMAYMDGCKEDK